MNEEDSLSGANFLPNNTLTLDDPMVKQENEKVICNDKMPNFDSSVKELTSNLSVSDSLSKNSVTLEDLSYISPKIVPENVDKLTSNEVIIYLGGSNSVTQNTAISEDHYQIDLCYKDCEPTQPLTFKDPNYTLTRLLLNSDEETGYLCGNDSSVSQNTVKLEDPSHVSPLVIPDIVDQLISYEDMCGTDSSVPQDTVKLEDPSRMSPLVIPDIVDHLISNEDSMCSTNSVSQKILTLKNPNITRQIMTSNLESGHLIETDSLPKSNIAYDDPNYLALQKKSKVVCQNDTGNGALNVMTLTSNEETGCGIDSSVPQNTVELEDPNFVSPLVIADILDQLISNEDIMSSTDSVSQKTLTLKNPNITKQIMTSNEESSHLIGTDSLPKSKIVYDDPNYLAPQKKLKVICQNDTGSGALNVMKLTSNEETGNGTHSSVPKNIVKLGDERDSYASPQVIAHIVDQPISDDEITYLGSKSSVPQSTVILKNPDYTPLKPLINSSDETNHFNRTDFVQKTSVDNDPNYIVPRKKIKFHFKSETTNTDLSVKKITSNGEKEYFNDTNSVPQNPVNLKDPTQVFPKVVVDQLISNKNETYSDSELQKSAMPGDPIYGKHQVDSGFTDSESQITLASKDPTYVPPQQVFENEKADIVDPRWETIKELSSNEARYKQVKACWGSSTVPDPDKNLTYHSFRRKKLLRSGEFKQRVKQQKRKASTALTNETKRPCTYLVDKEISEIVRKKEAKSREIQTELNRVIEDLRERQYHEEMRYGNNMAFYNRNGENSYGRYYRNTFLSNLRHEHQREIVYIQNKYHKKTDELTSMFDPKLNELENVRQEVLQFYTFYKGMGINVEKDPTVLTEFQLKMLNDIENFYEQMKRFYK